MSSSPIVCITGASSGIGWATASLLAQKGFRLILCGRRKERLHDLQKKLMNHTQVFTLCFDVGYQEQVRQAFSTLPVDLKDIHILINNAGNAHGLGPIQGGQVQDWDAMIDSNIKGLLYVTNEVMPAFVSRQSGHIINIGSIAGKEVYPNGNVYCATKSAVDALTQGMRVDMNPLGIKVTAIHPGLVETEFSQVRFKGDIERAKKTYQGITPLTAGDIADIIYYVIQSPPHVVLADVVVLPLDQASVSVAHRR